MRTENMWPQSVEFESCLLSLSNAENAVKHKLRGKYFFIKVLMYKFRLCLSPMPISHLLSFLRSTSSTYIYIGFKNEVYDAIKVNK